MEHALDSSGLRRIRSDGLGRKVGICSIHRMVSLLRRVLQLYERELFLDADLVSPLRSARSDSDLLLSSTLIIAPYVFMAQI